MRRWHAFRDSCDEYAYSKRKMGSVCGSADGCVMRVDPALVARFTTPQLHRLTYIAVLLGGEMFRYVANDK
jgi:hypothetical protein